MIWYLVDGLGDDEYFPQTTVTLVSDSRFWQEALKFKKKKEEEKKEEERKCLAAENKVVHPIFNSRGHCVYLWYQDFKERHYQQGTDVDHHY